MNVSRKYLVLFLAWTAALVLASRAQVVVTGSIGDTVFLDTNANDLPDAGEGAPGVTLTLYDETGVNVLATTMTDAGGQYLFAGLATGTYVVAVATNTLPGTPGQWTNTVDPDGGILNQATVTLPHAPTNGPLSVSLGTAETYAVLAGSTATSTGDTTVDGDLGLSPGLAVTGFPPGIVSNGLIHIYDAPAIQVQVDLVIAYNDAAGRGVDATLAAELGGTTLTPGVYNSADTTFGITGTLTLDAQDDANAVFIFQAGSTLTTASGSDVVLINGAQAGNVFWQVGSSATLGTYSTFRGTILALTSITLTTGASVEGRVLARNGAVTMDTNAIGLPRLAGENDLDQDFGYRRDPPNTISGTLWEDLNEDGLLGGGESGRFVGVTVDLQDTNGAVLATTATDAAGAYSFTNLPDATYVVDVTDTGNVLADYGHTLGPSPGSDNNSQSDPFTVVVSGGESNTTGDFGYYLDVASLGDFVWLDADADGVQDAGEAGIAGVGVTLYDAVDVAVGSATTDGNGEYAFTGLTPGVYHVGFAIPPGSVASPRDQGGDDARDSDANVATGLTDPTTLVVGENDLTWDLGLYQEASLGDFVWLDADADGVQDAGELGVSGVVVTLYDAADVAVDSATTDANGAYGFADLVPGVYHVGFAISLGSVASPRDQGGDDALDSDANVATGLTDPTTLVVGENDLTWDLGLYQEASLGDFVWLDADADGMQDAGELGVSGVVVTLYDAADVAVDSATTDANGEYAFTGLIPGVYHVGFAIPPGSVASPQDEGGNDALDSDADPATGLTDPTTLVVGENDLTWDLGLYQEASLGDFVWLDADADGVQDAGELGVSGVVVTLYDAADVAVGLATTDGNGEYAFIGLTPGVYHVGFAIPPGSVASPRDQGGDDARDSDANVATGLTDPTTLVVGENDLTWDLGLYQVASLGDFVWLDADADGVQDAGEAGIAGVGVTLYDAADVAVDSATTDANGEYAFTGLIPGVYHVGFAIPPGSVASPRDQGGDDARDSDANVATGRTDPTTLVVGENDLTWDLGLYQVASLGDFVWLDADADGVQDAGEAGIAGVGVTLYDAADVAVDSATTDANGEYAFTGLIPGVYHVGFAIPPGYVASPQDQGGDDARDSDANVATGLTDPTTLVVGENDLTWDLGLYQVASLGDFVWLDADADGVQDAGEAGIAGVGVTLYDAADVVVDSTTTDGNGEYAFTGLIPGVYHVGFAIPPGSVASPRDQGGDDARDSDADPVTGRTDPTTLVVGENDLTWDLGLYQEASLGDFVWLDADADGMQDAGELGVSGVVVTLYDAADVAVDSATTDANGEYAFTGLTPGVYHVGFAIPPGSVASPRDQGGDDARDSDANVATGRTDPTTLVAGENDLTWDLGLYQEASLGDFVWLDADADGMQDAGELGVSGVVVTLYDAADVAVGSATTDVDGAYGFADLVPGVYHVGFAIPPGYVASPQDQCEDARDCDANVATGLTIPTTLVAGENDRTWDLGLRNGSQLLAVIGNVEAFTREGQAVVRWETIESWNTAGFWLERLVGDEWVRISESLLPFPLFGTSPIVFEETDPGVQAGGTYFWRLVELENSGNELTYGPYLLTVDGPGRTYADWAAVHFTPEELADPTISGQAADADGDGLTNGQEFLAWTDPNQADSVLRIQSVSQASDGLELGWDSVAGRYYRIALSDSVAGPFLPLAEPILATDGNSQATLSVDFQGRLVFFQVILVGEAAGE